MVHVFPLNMKKTLEKGVMEFKPIETKGVNECEYKLIFSSIKNKQEETQRSMCEFLLNVTLVESIFIKTDNKEYEMIKIPFHGLRINFDSFKDKLVVKIIAKDYCSKIKVWDMFEKGNYEYTDIMWDKIYIINLKRRPERRECMTMQMEEHGIQNYEFIEAVDGKDEEIKQEYEKLKEEKKTIIISEGHYGCLKSHIKAILKARRERIKNIMILEDDAILEKDFLEKLRNTKIPKYDMLYLGGLTRSIKIFFEEWGRANGVMGTYGYILNEKMYNRVVVGMMKNNIYADTYYVKEIQEKKDTNVFIMKDVIKTTIEETDTSNKSTLGTKPLEYINQFEKYGTLKKIKI